jgi:hypothetical protein
VVLAANACSWNFTASRLIYAGGRTGVFPAVFGRLSKKNIRCPAFEPVCPVSFSDNGNLYSQVSSYVYDASCKPELYFPVWLYHNCVLEN